MMEVIEKIEVTQKELLASGEDFDYEIKCSQSKKKMFNEEIENLKNIEELYLYGCSLEGSIPIELGQLKNLKNFSSHENKELTG